MDMKRTTTANELHGRAIGSLFFAGFGAIWIGLALYVKQLLTLPNIAFAGMDLVVLVAMAVLLIRRSSEFTKVDEDPAIRRTFHRINGTQWIAVSLVAFSFARLHLDAYAMCAITAIVGLHFFPLARLFRYRMHHVTGAVLVVWAGLSAALVPVEHLQGISAMGTGIILWVSAFTTLMLAFTAVRRRTILGSMQRTA